MPALQSLKSSHLDALLDWYRAHQRDFPWRRDPQPYRVWLAEIMSQQTTMAQLVPYFYRFVDKFPSVEALAAAEESEVLAAWAGLGYYSRARNIHAAAKKIVAAGAFPRDVAGWLELPGVGPYTAAAVASQCFGVEEPVWDGNVTRVCARLEASAEALTNAFRLEATAALRDRMRGRDASHFNQALMELGATVCTPKAPSCDRCPVSAACRARKLEAVEKYPPPKARKAQVELRCAVEVRLRPDAQGKYEVYLEPRGRELWFAGLWDFPSELGGAGEPRRKLEGSGKPAATLGGVRHQITHHKIHLEGRVIFIRKTNKSNKATRGRWVSLEELTRETPPLPLSTTARKVIKQLLRARTDQLALL